MTLATSLIDIDPSQMVFSPAQSGILIDLISASQESGPEVPKVEKIAGTLEANIAQAASKVSGLKTDNIAHDGGSQVISAPKPENSQGPALLS